MIEFAVPILTRVRSSTRFSNHARDLRCLWKRHHLWPQYSPPALGPLGAEGAAYQPHLSPQPPQTDRSCRQRLRPREDLHPLPPQPDQSIVVSRNRIRPTAVARAFQPARSLSRRSTTLAASTIVVGTGLQPC